MTPTVVLPPCNRLSCLAVNWKWPELIAQAVQNLPAMQEIQVQSLGWEDPLEKGMATPSGILAWRNPMDKGAWRAAVYGVAKSQT